MNFTLIVKTPPELRGWWVNTVTTTVGGLVTNPGSQTCGEVRFNESMTLRNLNLKPGTEGYEHTTRIYLNEDYCISWHCISWRNRKMCEQIQMRLGARGVTTQLLQRVAKDKDPNGRTLVSAYAPVRSDADGVTEMPT